MARSLSSLLPCILFPGGGVVGLFLNGDFACASFPLGRLLNGDAIVVLFRPSCPPVNPTQFSFVPQACKEILIWLEFSFQMVVELAFALAHKGPEEGLLGNVAGSST